MLIVVLLHPVLSLTVVLFGLLEGAGRFYCAFICLFLLSNQISRFSYP